MTKAQLIEKVLLSVAGGNPTDETLTMRPDIEIYLELAIQEYIAQEQERAEIMALRMARVAGTPINSAGSSAFVKAFELPFVEGEDYVILPSFYKSKGGGIESGRVSLTSPIQIIFSPKELDGIYDTVGGQIFGYHEKMDTEDRFYVINKPTGCTKITVRLTPTFSALGDDDDVPLPSLFAATIIDRTVAHFNGDKWIADYSDDEVDRPRSAPQNKR